MNLFKTLPRFAIVVMVLLFAVCLSAIASSKPAEAGVLGGMTMLPFMAGMMGQTSGIEKSAKCTAAVTAFTIAKFGADDDTFSTAAANSDELIGVFQHDTANAGDEVRIMLEGITRIKLGTGGITRGAMITSDASGQGVAIGAVAGTNYVVIGKALASGSAGDIVPMLLVQSRPQG